MSSDLGENPFRNLSGYLSACQKSYSRCIDVVEHPHIIDIEIADATMRLHHLKFDGNGQPMVAALAETLYLHIINYCIAVQNRPSPLTPVEAARLTKEARKLFVHPATTPDDPDRTGEAGEILLYFLLESVLGVPQVIAKMEHKMNPRLELAGSDGVHMCWNEKLNLVDLYFGEAKLYQDVSTAIGRAIESINKFHDDGMLTHEFTMVTKHFKYADENVKKAVTQLLELGTPTADMRINHACLIGYNYEEYVSLKNIAGAELTKEFRKRLAAHSQQLHGFLNGRFRNFQRKHLRFEVFFVPFPTVQGFRDAFNKALG